MKLSYPNFVAWVQSLPARRRFSAIKSNECPVSRYIGEVVGVKNACVTPTRVYVYENSGYKGPSVKHVLPEKFQKFVRRLDTYARKNDLLGSNRLSVKTVIEIANAAKA